MITAKNIFIGIALFCLSVLSHAVVVGDKVAVANTNGIGLNVRVAAGTGQTSLGKVYDTHTGTVVAGSTNANGLRWWKVQWDGGLLGWSAEDYMTVLADNAPSLSNISISQNFNITAGKQYFSGSASDDWNLREVGMYVDGRLAFSESVSGKFVSFGNYWFDPNNANYGKGAGTYSVQIYAADAKLTSTKSFNIIVTTSTPPNTSPSFSGVTNSYNFRSPGSVSFSGSITDDKAISSVNVYISKSGVSENLAFSHRPNSTSYSLSNFYFRTSDSYYSGGGIYNIRIVAQDAAGLSSTQSLTVTVTQDNSARIAEIRNKINANNSTITNANSTLATLKNDNNNLEIKIAGWNSDTKKLQDQFNAIILPTPYSPTTTSNKTGLPSGCVIVNYSAIPYDLPILAGKTYQAVAQCYQNPTGKGDVFLLLGYTNLYTGYSCNAAPNYSFSYPAAVLFNPKKDSTLIPLIQPVQNKDQALFWTGFYKSALDGSLSAALASARSDSATSTLKHPDESLLSQISTNYQEYRTELRDYIEESIYEIDSTLTEEELKIILEILSASLGSIPYIQEVKGGVELCSGEDILTSEPVSVWDSWTYVVPFGKIATKFDKYKHLSKITKILGGNSTELFAFSKNLVSPSARNLANQLGEIGERSVRNKFPNIGNKVTVSIKMKEGMRKPDALSPTTLSEIKNRKSVSCTSQLRDYADHAKSTNRNFDLYVRPDVAPLILANKSFQKGGKCWPVNIISHTMSE